MKLFIDSADLDEIRAAAALGVLDGVTTNPGLLAACDVPVAELVPEICSIVDGPVSVPVRGDNRERIVEAGRAAARLHDNVVIKVPLHGDGLGAMSRLRSEGIRTHATLCCSASQALLAARCGAWFVSPFVGRVDALGASGTELVAQIVDIYDNYEFDTQIMVASVRSVMHVQESALLGADACTMPLAVLEELVRHPLTETLHAEYLADWTRS
ncbi:MAG: transaldolase family protein [Candidatus Krumholzibacteriia bacterium]